MGRKLLGTLCAAVMVALVAGCSPEEGSEAWCDALEETPKGDWSTNDATAYAQHCVFRQDDD